MDQLRFLLRFCALLGIYTEYAQIKHQQQQQQTKQRDRKERSEKQQHGTKQQQQVIAQEQGGLEQEQRVEDFVQAHQQEANQDEEQRTNQHCLYTQGSWVHPFCILIISWLIWLYLFLLQYTNDGFLLTWLVSTLVISTQTLTNAAIMLESIFTRRQHDDFIERIAECEAALSLLCLPCEQQQKIIETHHRKLCQQLNVLGILTILSWLVFMCFASKTYVPSYFWMGLFSNVVIRARILQLLAYVHLLLPYLKCFNAKLMQVVQQQYWQFDNVEVATQLPSREMLICLRRYYGNVYDAFKALNHFAGWSLFTIIACYFLDFTCHLYWALLSLDEVLPRYSLLASVATLLQLSLVVCCFCAVCQACKAQGMRARLLNNKLLGVVATPQRSSRAYVNLVYEFALQLRHQALTVSAMNFFNIDLRLIGLISVSIATYLVILIQFLSSGTSK